MFAENKNAIIIVLKNYFERKLKIFSSPNVKAIIIVS